MKLNSGINYIQTIENTNSFMLDYPSVLENGTALYTLNQTKGKGRRGRVWQGAKGDSLALSTVYNLDISQASVLPLIAGLSVVEAVKELTGTTLQLKWSNDVVFKGKKIAGILCESRGVGGKTRVVIGIGINIFGTAESFGEKGLAYASSLKEILGKAVIPKKLVEKIGYYLDKNITEYINLGFTAIKERYIKNCITLGSAIVIEEKGIKKIGEAVGINADGALIYTSQGEENLAYGGEVSVRGIYGYT